MEYDHLLLLWMVFLGFFLHGLVFLIKDSRSTWIIDAALMDFRYWLKLSKVFLSDGIPTLITFLHTLHVIEHYFCSKWCEDNSDNKNDHFILMVLLLIMQIVLLLKYNPILYYLKSSKFFFSHSELYFETYAGSFSNISINISTINICNIKNNVESFFY